MKTPSIYPQRSQELLSLFEGAGNNSKVMCIPIDYAKKDHLVMFCNGNGQVLRKPFSVNNTPDGVAYLIDQVNRSCRHRHIQPQHVFFGGEDVNSYAENFANTLQAKGWLVANVNAHDAKKQRENLQASTDRIDLMGIAAMLLNRRANCCAPSWRPRGWLSCCGLRQRATCSWERGHATRAAGRRPGRSPTTSAGVSSGSPEQGGASGDVRDLRESGVRRGESAHDDDLS